MEGLQKTINASSDGLSSNVDENRKSTNTGTVLYCELLTKEHGRRHVWRQIQGQEQEKGCSQSTLGGWVVGFVTAKRV